MNAASTAPETSRTRVRYGISSQLTPQDHAKLPQRVNTPSFFHSFGMSFQSRFECIETSRITEMQYQIRRGLSASPQRAILGYPCGLPPLESLSERALTIQKTLQSSTTLCDITTLCDTLPPFHRLCMNHCTELGDLWLILTAKVKGKYPSKSRTRCCHTASRDG